jgi:DNA primase
VTLPEDLVIERRPVSTQRNELKIEPPPFFTLLASGSGKDAVSLKPARDYLRSRGLPEDVWEAANIGACAAGPYAGRVVIPVLAEDGKTWFGFSSRLWTAKCDKRLKYRNAVGEWKSHVVYNPNALTEETDEPCYVVEGCFDALAHWPHAVAVLGDASDAQVEIMSKARRPLVVVLDGDAWVKGWSLAMKLRLEGVTAGAVQLPPGKDPDEVDPSWLWEEARASLA